VVCVGTEKHKLKKHTHTCTLSPLSFLENILKELGFGSVEYADR
jgi:hypothetical protein